jgi:C4-dicarboxylate-specific signal transduction histidine kinase
MQEDDNMTPVMMPVRKAEESRGVDEPMAGAETTVSTEVLARLQRLATASLMAAGLAHEISNPLTALAGGLSALDEQLRRIRRHAANAEDFDLIAANADLMAVSVEAMTGLIRDFRGFVAMSEMGSAKTTDLAPAVERAIRMARTRLVSVSPLSVSLSSVPPVRVPANRVTQIVLNLLLNAADALSHRPWASNVVQVRVAAVEGQATILVKDNGPGIAPEIRSRVFEPGVSTKRGGGALGLGLAISRNLARMSRGDISVSCPPEGGAAFVVTFPIEEGVGA